MTIVQLLNTDKYNRNENRFYKRYNDPVIRENGEHREYISGWRDKVTFIGSTFLNNGEQGI
jgi:hypothetical protein